METRPEKEDALFLKRLLGFSFQLLCRKPKILLSEPQGIALIILFIHFRNTIFSYMSATNYTKIAA